MCGTIGTVNGRDNVAAMIGTFIAALPDLKATEQVVVAEGDYVFVWGVVEGTHRGDFFGVPPTGGKLHFDAPDLYRITDGKIAKEWGRRRARDPGRAWRVYARPDAGKVGPDQRPIRRAEDDFADHYHREVPPRQTAAAAGRRREPQRTARLELGDAEGHLTCSDTAHDPPASTGDPGA
jgi:ketosteroid isomerase-like protein